MKKPLKERLIHVLKTDVKKWNRYVKFSLSRDIGFTANLQGANLQGANLQWAKLQWAKLQWAKLQGANLQGANLQGAKLQGANLQWAKLQGAKLQGANIDMSCLPLWCGSLNFKSDLRIRTQIAFHFASLIANAEEPTEEEKKIYSDILDYVNKFHRTDVERLKPLQ